MPAALWLSRLCPCAVAVDSAQRFPDAPRLSPAQVEALDLFDALLDDPRLHFRMLLEPGDLQFCYSQTLLHDRCAFEDHPEVRLLMS